MTPCAPSYFDEVNPPALRLATSLASRGRLLDVGCGRGALGAALRERGFEVIGIERSESAAVARARGLEVIESNLLDLDRVRSKLALRTVDAVMMSDVLEHLADPLDALSKYVSLARTGAAFIVSVPNVAVWTTRLSLLLGRFDYGDSGVLDSTHLRFFTEKSAKALMRAAGLSMDKMDVDPMITRAALPLIKHMMGDRARPESIARSRGYSAYLRHVHPVERAVAAAMPGLLAFRIALLGRKRPR